MNNIDKNKFVSRVRLITDPIGYNYTSEILKRCKLLTRNKVLNLRNGRSLSLYYLNMVEKAFKKEKTTFDMVKRDLIL